MDYGNFLAKSSKCFKTLGDGLEQYSISIRKLADMDDFVEYVLNPKGYFMDTLRCSDKTAYAIARAIYGAYSAGDIDRYMDWYLRRLHEEAIKLTWFPKDPILMKDSRFMKIVQNVVFSKWDTADIKTMVSAASSQYLNDRTLTVLSRRECILKMGLNYDSLLEELLDEL